MKINDEWLDKLLSADDVERVERDIKKGLCVALVEVTDSYGYYHAVASVKTSIGLKRKATAEIGWFYFHNPMSMGDVIVNLYCLHRYGDELKAHLTAWRDHGRWTTI